MVNKYYCDICGKEITEKNTDNALLTNKSETLRVYDICEEHFKTPITVIIDELLNSKRYAYPISNWNWRKQDIVRLVFLFIEGDL